jgi:excisionase family DNA binding protein
MPKMLTIMETCEYLKVSRYAVKRLIDEGKLRAVKVLSDWRVSEDAIQDFMRENSNIKGEK